MNDARAGLTIDHIAHYVPDSGSADAALSALGYTVTPFSAQSHRLTPDGPLAPAGTGNRCVMLRDGYLEFLTPTHDTANARQLQDAIARYTGVHLIAFGTQTPDTDFTRLQAGGFAPLPPVALQRQTTTATGEATARFTVVRVAPAAMAEGRIQFCQHHTPDVVWQPRWLDHANQAVGLAGVLICVADPAAAAQRYARFSGLPVVQSGNTWRLDCARGYLLFFTADTLRQTLGVTAPAQPWIAGYVIDSSDMATTRTVAEGKRVTAGVNALGNRLCIMLPPALGGIMIFQPSGSDPLSFA
jgi:hypothetical protein